MVILLLVFRIEVFLIKLLGEKIILIIIFMVFPKFRISIKKLILK